MLDLVRLIFSLIDGNGFFFLAYLYHEILVMPLKGRRSLPCQSWSAHELASCLSDCIYRYWRRKLPLSDIESIVSVIFAVLRSDCLVRQERFVLSCSLRIGLIHVYKFFFWWRHRQQRNRSVPAEYLKEEHVSCGTFLWQLIVLLLSQFFVGSHCVAWLISHPLCAQTPLPCHTPNRIWGSFTSKEILKYYAHEDTNANTCFQVRIYSFF